MSEQPPAETDVHLHRATVETPTVAVDEPLRAALAEAYRAELGTEPTILGEIVPEGMRLDLYLFDPTPERPYITVATMGMSELPMSVPEGLGLWRRAELVLTLPPSWPLHAGPDGADPLRDENYYWPLRLLKDLARMPMRFNTWVGHGHTIQNDPAGPYAPRTRLEAAILGEATTLSRRSVYTPSGAVWLYGVYPIYGSELELKLHTNADELFERLRGAGIQEGVLNPVRPPVA